MSRKKNKATQKKPTSNPRKAQIESAAGRVHKLQQPNSGSTTVTREAFFGPIPHPGLLEKYEQILPGAADRILTMAEDNSKAQKQLDESIVTGTLSEMKRGQIFGFSIAVIALGISATLSLYGDSVTASIIGGATVVGLVATFITGHFKKD